jgi:DNA-binding response OmpR family regulator
MSAILIVDDDPHIRELARVFLQHERTFSRDQLIEDIWGYDFAGNERTLDVHVNRLRERFPEDHHSFRIRTIRGLGYRLEVGS